MQIKKKCWNHLSSTSLSTFWGFQGTIRSVVSSAELNPDSCLECDVTFGNSLAVEGWEPSLIVGAAVAVTLKLSNKNLLKALF